MSHADLSAAQWAANAAFHGTRNARAERDEADARARSARRGAVAASARTAVLRDTAEDLRAQLAGARIPAAAEKEMASTGEGDAIFV